MAIGSVYTIVVSIPVEIRPIDVGLFGDLREIGGFSVVHGDAVSRLAESETTTTDSGRAPRPKLMIVDDDPEVRIVVAEFLEEFGYRVLQADGGAQALEVLERTPDLRMIITDIRMPDMSGIELADEATQRRHDLKVILISGYFVSQQVNRRFLRKPFRMRELEAAVRAELNE
jgi:CheY-like chemotaxis protein